MDYIFILGRSSELCRAELESLLHRLKINFSTIYSSQDIYHLNSKDELDYLKLNSLLGGTIKISEVSTSSDNDPSIDKIKPQLIDLLKNSKNDFGLSFYGKKLSYQDLAYLNKEIKKEIGGNYVLPKDGLILSSVVVSKRKVREINLVEEDRKIILSRTKTVQDFEDWGKRDYQRPAVDPSKGMMPPKVSRIMINLGLSKFEKDNNEITLLDPFCGVGTILSEANLLGLKVIGSDIDKNSISKSKLNLEWLNKVYNLQSNFQLFVEDATHLTKRIKPESIDLIATEPYLGPLMESMNNELRIKNQRKELTEKKINNIITGLEKLYIGSLREWTKILKSESYVVIALPSFTISLKRNNQIIKKTYFVKRIIDNCEKLGYNLQAGPYHYSRPEATVQRNIYIFKKLKA